MHEYPRDRVSRVMRAMRVSRVMRAMRVIRVMRAMRVIRVSRVTRVMRVLLLKLSQQWPDTLMHGGLGKTVYSGGTLSFPWI